MKHKHFFTGCMAVGLTSFASVTVLTAQSLPLKPVFKEVAKQTKVLLAEVPKVIDATKPRQLFPRTIEKGHLKLVSATDWTSGFFPGVLWFLYDYTGKKEWRSLAEQETALMEKEQWNKTTHDMGFKMYCSYGSGYRLTKNAAYKEILLQSARTLCTRFNPTIGCIRSWDNRKWAFPVIIDNMMNLELLFAATRLSGDSSFYRIAVNHANTTLRNHFRADHSSYHVVSYDSTTGAVIERGTHQGYADESAWARGQAWGLYGFTMCYRETKNPGYLQHAEAIAAFILKHPNLPADKVPYWDFNDPAIPGVPRDASAAAVTASALLELSNYSVSNKKEYEEAAMAILTSLTNQYRSPLKSNYGFILLHSTGHKPANSEIDVPLNYADYYYLEALLRYRDNRNK
jgi:cbb3-type cytochrome oxidase subunit 3